MNRRTALTPALKYEILRLFGEKVGLREIARKLNIQPATVHYIVQKNKKYNTVDRIAGSGRKMSLDAEDRKLLRNIVEDAPKTSTSKLACRLLEEKGKNVCEQTIRNALNDEGFHGFVARKIPLLSKKKS